MPKKNKVSLRNKKNLILRERVEKQEIQENQGEK